MDLEEKLIRNMSARMIERKYRSIYGTEPEGKTIRYLVEKFIDKLKEEFGALYLIRHRTPDGNLTPIIKKYVDEFRIA